MTDRRDTRDPSLLGQAFLDLRDKAPKREKAPMTYDRHHGALLSVPPFVGGPFMSSNPSEHHSKTKQDIEQGEPGGDG